MPEETEPPEDDGESMDALSPGQLRWLKGHQDSPFFDLFSEPPPEPKPLAKPRKATASTGGGQEVPDNQAAKTMGEIVRNLGEGLAKGLSEGKSSAGGTKEPGAAPPPPPRTRKHWLWGETNID